MKYIKSFFEFFTAITTAILIIISIVTAIGGYEHLSRWITLQVLGAGAVCALITVIVLAREPKNQKQFFFTTVIHYILLCTAMIFMGVAFNWVSPEISGIIAMLVEVAVVYGIVYTITYITEKKEADKLNRALEKRRKKQ